MMSTDKSQPLVTVYMPTYNRVELLQRAVDSVLDQDHKNIELIVVDDNSTDSTHNYLAKMAEEDFRFRYFINEKNSGACVSRNKAIWAANGEFITGLDDDDFFLPNHVSSLIKSWSNLDKTSIAIFPYSYKKTKETFIPIDRKIVSCDSKDLLVHNWIGNQIFTRTDYLKQIQGFDEALPAWQDLECWYRLLKHYNAVASPNYDYSYVVDTSHPHERITTGKTSSIVNAYQYFCKKHNLSNLEKQVLGMQLSPYTGSYPSIKSILTSMFYSRKNYNFKKIYYKYLTAAIKKDAKKALFFIKM